MSLIVKHYQPRTLYLIDSKGVLASCYNSYKIPKVVPKSWENIYERTAAEFGMKKRTLKSPVDAQLYSGHNPVLVENFFELKIERAL